MKPNFADLLLSSSASSAIVEDETRTLSLLSLTLLGLLLGIVTGIGAVLFRELIGLLHNLFFAGQFAFAYDANEFTAPSRWGAFVILAPVVGGVIVTFLVSNFAPEAKGHGVPEVMDAIYYKEGMIRPIVALVKSLASALAIGSGSSVGREGPIIQIGSAIGSTLGQIVRMPAGQRITLVAAGAGAGIAATFNTPIGGVMFAIELMLPEVSVDTFLPVAIATGAATFVGRWFFGDQPAFQVPPIVAMTPHANTVSLLLLYTLLGALVGVAAAGFVRGTASRRGRLRPHPLALRAPHAGHADGGRADVRAVSRLRPVLRRRRRLQHDREHPHRRPDDDLAARPAVRLQDAGDFDQPRLGLVGRHLLAVAVHGRDAGRRLRLAARRPGLHMPLSVPAFAMVGMGAMVGGGTGAVMTAVTMIFEMTLDYDIVMPMILAVAMSVGVRRLLSRETHLHAEAGPPRPHVPKARTPTCSWCATHAR